MTVNNVAFKVTYVGDGVTTVFPFSFPNDGRESSIVVYYRFANGTIRQLILDTEYSVTLNNPIAPNPTEVGGFVTAPAFPGPPPVPVGDSITIVRILPAEQTSSIANQSIIYPPVIEQRLDYLTMVDQELSGFIGQAIRVPISDPPPAMLPPQEFRKNQQAVFDGNGDLVAGGAVIGTIISGAMIPVVTAPSLGAARSAMGVPPVDSPTFTGDPKAPTPATSDNDTSIATTAYVQNRLSAVGAQFPSGTRIVFQQNTAPPGWTKEVNHNDKALRLVNGTCTAGGVFGFSTVFGRVTTDPFTLTSAEIPAHAHVVNDPGHYHNVVDGGHFHTVSAADGSNLVVNSPSGGHFSPSGSGEVYNNMAGKTSTDPSGVLIVPNATGISLFPSGGGAPHSHGMDNRLLYLDVIIAQKD